MIVFIASLIPFGCMLFAFFAYSNDQPMWFWHSPNDKQNPIKKEHIVVFNRKVAYAFFLVSFILYIPCITYEFGLLKKHLTFSLVCSLFTVCFLGIMFYWHTLFKKYK